MRLRWYHRAALPLIPVMLLPFLAAPTCSGPVVGPRAFGDDSLVIPMDECWQPYNQSDKEPGSVPLGGAGSVCSSSYTKGVLYAYGLVYYLIQNNVPVYWIIDPNKTSVSGVDFTVPGAASQGNLYDWGRRRRTRRPTTARRWASRRRGAAIRSAHSRASATGAAPSSSTARSSRRSTICCPRAASSLSSRTTSSCT